MGTLILDTIVKNITIHTVATIGPIEFSANTESKIPNEAITVSATAAYPKAAKYLHNTSSFVICNICDSSPFTLKISMSSAPKINRLTNNAITAIHINKKTVNKNEAKNFTMINCVLLTGFVMINRNVPIFASPEIASPAINATNIGTCTNKVLRMI